MRPLIFWARDRRATLRLSSRSSTAVSGHITIDAQPAPFHFNPQTLVLTLGEGESLRVIQLNEYGWEI